MKRVAVLGKNTIAVKATEILTDNGGCEIAFVSPNNSDSAIDSWQLSFKKYAELKNLPVKPIRKIKSEESISFLISQHLDFIFSFQYDQIINQDVIDTAKFGAINLHFAPLPRYRGVSPVGLAMLNGENEFGVTIHYMDPGVDTGDIICQKPFDMTSLKNARELYDLCLLKGLELLEENLDEILDLRNTRLPQDNSKALYYPAGFLDFKKNMITWNKDTWSLYNWVRAFIFPPFQFPLCEFAGKVFEITAASPDYRKNNFEKPGTVIIAEPGYYKVATHDSYMNILVRDYQNLS